MKFSVIIPAYCAAATLRKTVESIRCAGLDDYEIILVDDGSKDATPSVCDRLCEQYCEVSCIHQENAGVSAARNRGIEKAKGEYLLFFDADDTVREGALRHAAQIVCEQQPDMLIYGMEFQYYYHKRQYRTDYLVPPIEGMVAAQVVREKFGELYASNSLSSACNKIICRELVIENRIRFREGMNLLEDFLFVLNLLPLCQSIYCLPEAIYQYCQAEDEKAAYHRLSCIQNLGNYMRPFEEGVCAVGAVNSKKFLNELYRGLLIQKMYWANSPKAIENILRLHYQGSYASLPVEDNPWKIYFHNQKSHLRHRVAVVVKAMYSRIK